MNNQELDIAIQRLNTNQRLSIETIDGPVMVIAGPGTGKTQVLALRIANILLKTDTSPENILCLTFTEAGVRAMRERLSKFIGSAAYKIAIHTYHSFTNEIIQSNPDVFSTHRELKQLDDLKKVQTLQTIIDELILLDDYSEFQVNGFDEIVSFGNRYFNLRNIQSAISTLKKEGISAKDAVTKSIEIYNEHLEAEQFNINKKTGKPTNKWKDRSKKLLKQVQTIHIYQLYQASLYNNGQYDFDDMILFVLNAFESDENLLANYQERYLYIHVDEYQDTNGAQNKLISHLGSFDSSPNIFAVGDDDQAIYRFQGANLANLLYFRETFQDVTVIPNDINYRSSQNILDLAESLITHNSQRLVTNYDDIHKSLKQGNKSIENEISEVWTFANEQEEHLFIADEIKKLHQSGCEYSDIAILYRKNVQGRSVANSLIKLGIPVKSDAASNLFESVSVNQIVHLLKVINMFDDNMDEYIYRLLLFEFWEIDALSIYRFNDLARSRKIRLVELLIEVADKPDDFSEIIDTKIITIAKNIINWHKASFNSNVQTFFEMLLTQSGILEYYSKYLKDNKTDEISAEESEKFGDLLAVISFMNFVKMQDMRDSENVVNDLVNLISLIKENNLIPSLPKVDTEKDSVVLSTAHSSKGLEYKYVFIVGANYTYWGKSSRDSSLITNHLVGLDVDEDDKSIQLEDERRLFFVAITRAISKVYFTYSKEYIDIYNNQTKSSEISLFINELDPTLLEFKSPEQNDKEFNSKDYLKLLGKPDITILGNNVKAYLKEKLETFKLSPSALNTFLKSPYEFKESYLIRVPTAKSKQLAMGTAVHFALEMFNRDLINLEDQAYSLDQILKNYEKKLIEEFEGFSDFNETLVEGKKIISKYFEHYKDSIYSSETIMAEYNFGYQNIYFSLTSGKNIQLTGKIDKVELVDEASSSVKVVDYKTSAGKSENDIKGLTQSSTGSIWRQLVFYKLLVDMDSNFRPNRDLRKPKYILESAEVDFMKDTKGKFVRRSFHILDSDVEKLKLLINYVMEKIYALEFPEEPNVNWKDYL